MFKLKRIELLGFKSFADRTRLEFGDGTVAIVGPNGCGKSNISDAISWVLGEQSAKSLRGERMADVIFNGTGKRSATSMAEASLTLVDPEYTEAPAKTEMEPLPFPGSQDPAASTISSSAPENGSAELLTPNGEADADTETRRSTLWHRSGEITVTRRLFRSGESEYLVNGETCRLRDIQDLFMGTGLGPESYAIIEQGRIGQILSSKPSDRRAILEEAAGISKFKTRKRLAEAKLESSRQNLARVTDILLEVTKQMTSLKRQAGKARRYREISEELRGRLAVVLRSQLIAQEAECQRLRAQVAGLQAECAEAAQRLEGLEREEKITRTRNEEIEDSLSQLRQSMAQRALDRERLSSRSEQIQEFSAGLEARAAETAVETEQLERDLADVEQQTSKLAQQADQIREDLASAQGAASALLGQQDQLTTEVSREDGRLEACRQELLVTVSRGAELRNQLTKAEEIGLSLERQLGRLSSEATALEDEHQRLSTEFNAFGLDRERETGTLTRLTENVAEATKALDDARLQASRHETELQALRHEFSSAAARKQALEESLARYAYSTETVRRLLSEPIPVNGHHFRPLGVLADFVEVSPGYEEPIEEFLKEALDCVVVECHEEARSGIAVLKSEGAGRSTFFVTHIPSNGDRSPHTDSPKSNGGPPEDVSAHGSLPSSQAEAPSKVDVMAETTSAATDAGHNSGNGGSGNGGSEYFNLNESIDATVGALVPLKDLVRFEASLGLNGDVALPVLGNTYFVEGAATAERLAASCPESHFLTRSGEHYHHRLVSGGRGASAGPLALRRDFRALERRTADLERSLRSAETQSAGLVQRVGSLDENLRSLITAKLDAEKKAAVAAEKLRQLREMVDRTNQRQSIVRQEIVILEEERQGLEACESSLRAEIQAATEEQTRHDEQIARMLGLVRQLQAQRDRVAHELLVAQARSSTLEERIRSLEAEDTRLLAHAEDLRHRMVRLREQQSDWNEQQQRFVTELQQVRIHLEEIEALQQGAGEQLSRLERESQGGRGRVSEILLLIDSARAAFDRLRETRSEADVMLARTESDLSHRMQQCREELKTDPAALLRENAEIEVLSGEMLRTAELELADLKTRLENLGPVNMMALEELQEAEERYGFLETQRQDLFSSIQDTTEAIREIDQVSRQQFLDAFTAINGHFAQSFRTLFGGGNGELRLTDESDPESGVDMVAQPPGKRLQNVLLLSGGEKALAALALLIAMFHYTPSPFCILDEVDAPLDESNVDRFTRLIQQMSHHTQFILITHNKRTMEISRALYGVTMEEPGVSKLVSVRFEDVAA